MQAEMQSMQGSPGASAREVVQLFFRTGIVVSLASALIFWAFTTADTASTYGVLVWCCLLEAVIFTVTGWWVRNASIERAVLAAAWSGVALICMVGVGMDEGLHALAMGFLSTLICITTIISGFRAGAAMTVFCLVWVLALAGAEHVHWLRGAAAVPSSPLPMRMSTLILMLGSSLSVGLMVASVIDAHLEAVHERERRYRTLFDRSPAGLLVHRLARVLDRNHAADRQLELDRLAMPAAAADREHAALDGEDRGVLEAVLQHGRPLEQAPAGAQLPTVDVELAGQDGKRRVLGISAVRIDSEWGPATLSMFVDESKRYGAELESKRKREQLHNLFEASPDCVMLTRLDGLGTFVMVNSEFSRLTGYGVDEATGSSVIELNLWHDGAEMARFIDAIVRDGAISNMIATFRVKDGRLRQIRLSANRFEFDGATYIAGLARDVTDSEQMRREQQAILGSAVLGILLTREGRVSQINEAGAAMFGLQPDQIEGFSSHDFWGGPGAASSAAMRNVYAALDRGELLDFEKKLARQDGSTFWCRLRGRAIEPGRSESGIVWTCEDITERRRNEQALSSARDAAEAASRAKSAFLANTSHEIRTPLNGLIGLTRLAMRPTMDERQRTQYLQQVLDSAVELAETMGAILDMSKIESGKLLLEEIRFDLHELLSALLSVHSPRASARGLGCEMSIAAEVPRLVVGDPVRTRQIVANLIDNAIKFTERGEVRVDVRCAAAGHVHIAVRDTGIGVDAETLGRLFQPFVQADNSTTRRFGGTGLGLSICRELAGLMGGRVGADSMPAQGSTFWAELPLPAWVQGDEQPGPQGEAEADSAGPASRAAETPAGAPAEPADPRSLLAGKRVLVAEDNPVNMIIVTTLLDDWGVEVIEAADGRAAIAAIDAGEASGRHIDLVLMDVQMPGMDGFAATRLLRARHDTSRLPIIALTAGDLVEERDAALACGMDAFLAKPIDEDALHATMIGALCDARRGDTTRLARTAERHGNG